MNELTLFGTELALVITTSIIVLIYIGKTLRNTLTEICGTSERADFWIAFIRLTFLFLPLLIVLFFGESACPQAANRTETARKFLALLMFGELMTLSVIGIVLWRAIASMNGNSNKEG